MKCLAENEMTMKVTLKLRLGMRGMKLSHENHQSSSSTCSSTWWANDVTSVKESVEWGFRPFREKVRTSSENGNLDREIHKQGVLKTRKTANDKGVKRVDCFVTIHVEEQVTQRVLKEMVEKSTS
jgi:hypothetical protein